MSIKVTIKTVYGREMIYPACDTAKLFATLAKQSTFTRREVELIKGLGYEVIVVTAHPQKL